MQATGMTARAVSLWGRDVAKHTELLLATATLYVALPKPEPSLKAPLLFRRLTPPLGAGDSCTKDDVGPVHSLVCSCAPSHQQTLHSKTTRVRVESRCRPRL